MNQLNISNVRMILDSYSRLNNASHLFGLPIAFSSSLNEGYSACYTISEERYKLKENYKISVVGNHYMFVPNEQFYQSDLRSLMEKSKNPHAGFYEIVDADSFQVGDIVSVDACHHNEKLFDLPLLIVAEDKSKLYVKLVIESFEKPPKKSLKDILTRNPYWDCAHILKEDVTKKYRKLSVDDVIPDVNREDENES